MVHRSFTRFSYHINELISNGFICCKNIHIFEHIFLLSKILGIGLHILKMKKMLKIINYNN